MVEEETIPETTQERGVSSSSSRVLEPMPASKQRSGVVVLFQ